MFLLYGIEICANYTSFWHQIKLPQDKFAKTRYFLNIYLGVFFVLTDLVARNVIFPYKMTIQVAKSVKTKNTPIYILKKPGIF